jgi:hypothetical protein
MQNRELFEFIILHFELVGALPLYIFCDPMALGSAGIGIGFIVAPANRIVLHGADTIFFYFFFAVFRFITAFSRSTNC